MCMCDDQASWVCLHTQQSYLHHVIKRAQLATLVWVGCVWLFCILCTILHTSMWKQANMSVCVFVCVCVCVREREREHVFACVYVRVRVKALDGLVWTLLLRKTAHLKSNVLGIWMHAVPDIGAQQNLLPVLLCSLLSLKPVLWAGVSADVQGQYLTYHTLSCKNDSESFFLSCCT
jgi:hypothetical protein